MNDDIERRFRAAVRGGRYDMTEHAVAESLEDLIEQPEIEAVLLDGRLMRIEIDDPRGPRYVIIGEGLGDGMEIAVVGKFKEDGTFTVWEVTER